jgi:hypothetical protein
MGAKLFCQKDDDNDDDGIRTGGGRDGGEEEEEETDQRSRQCFRLSLSHEAPNAPAQ